MNSADVRFDEWKALRSYSAPVSLQGRISAAGGWPRLLLLTLALITPPWSYAQEAAPDLADGAVESGPVEADSAPSEGAQDPRTFRDRVVVTATATEASPVEVPYRTHTLDLGSTEESAPRSLPEALHGVAGAMVQKTAHGQGSPYLRGFTGFRTLMLIDGVRLNSSIQRDGPNQYWNTVDLGSVERLEVVSGPASALYGSDSVGGTVQVLTEQAPTWGDGRAGAIDLRLSSAESSAVARLEDSGRLGARLGYRLGLTFKSFGDVVAGGETGEQPRTGYDEQDADLRLDWLADSASWTASWQSVSVDDAWRNHRTIFAIPFRGTTVGKELRRSLDQDRSLAYLRYRREGQGRFLQSLEANGSWQRQEEERDRLRSRERQDVQGFELNTLGMWLRGQTALDNSQWTWGLETYQDSVDSYRRDLVAGALVRERLQGPVANGADYRLSGAYAQWQMPVNDRLRLLVGGRWTHAEVDAPVVADPAGGDPLAIRDDWSRFTGNARFIWNLGERQAWSFFGGVSQAFRAPNLSDLTRFDSARSQEVETPSPGVEPEDFLSYEVGLRHHGAQGSLELTLFHTDIDGLIVRVPTGRVVDGEFEITKRNAGDGFSQGLEMTFQRRLGRHFALSGFYAWIDGEVDTFVAADAPARREPLDRLMPANGELTLRRQGGPLGLWVEVAARVSDRADRLSSRDRADSQRIPPGGTPGFNVYSLRAGVQLTADLHLRLAVENLTDEDYRVHGSGLNEPGRNLVASARWRF